MKQMTCDAPLKQELLLALVPVNAEIHFLNPLHYPTSNHFRRCPITLRPPCTELIEALHDGLPDCLNASSFSKTYMKFTA